MRHLFPTLPLGSCRCIVDVNLIGLPGIFFGTACSETRMRQTAYQAWRVQGQKLKDSAKHWTSALKAETKIFNLGLF